MIERVETLEEGKVPSGRGWKLKEGQGHQQGILEAPRGISGW